MSIFVYADGVKQTTTTAGLGAYELTPPTGRFRSIVDAIGDGNKSRFTVSDSDNFETFEGTVTDGSPDTLSRDRLLESTTGSWINWTPGTRDVFVMQPARSVMWVPLVDEAIASPVASYEIPLDPRYLRVIVEIAGWKPATDNAGLYARARVGGSIISANYTALRFDKEGSVITPADDVAQAQFAIGGGQASATAGLHTSGTMVIRHPGIAGLYKHFKSEVLSITSGGARNEREVRGYYAGGTGAWEGLQLSQSSGNIASAERVRAYGMRAMA